MPSLDILRGGQTRERSVRAAVGGVTGSGDPGVNEALGLSSRTASADLEGLLNAYKSAPTPALGAELRRVAGIVLGFGAESVDADALLALLGSALAVALVDGSGQAQARGAWATVSEAFTYGQFGVLSARDPLAYETRVFPTDGAAVNFLRAREGRLTHAFKASDRNAPTFNVGGGGTGYDGLRFTAASTQALIWPGTVPFQNADSQFTVWAVFRTAATPSGRQTVVSINRDGAANAFRECVRIDITATQFIVLSGTNGSAPDDTNSAVITQTPASGETYIVVGRHGTAAASDAFNKIDLRRGGSTTTATNANSLTLNYASTAALQQAVIGGYRRGGGWSQHFDGTLLDCGWYPFKIDDTQTAALITYLRGECGVS